MSKTRKLLYSLYAASAVFATSMLTGCQTQSSYSGSNNSSGTAGEIISGVLMGIGQGLSGL